MAHACGSSASPAQASPASRLPGSSSAAAASWTPPGAALSSSGTAPCPTTACEQQAKTPIIISRGICHNGHQEQSLLLCFIIRQSCPDNQK
jgi:hypothetical protein